MHLKYTRDTRILPNLQINRKFVRIGSDISHFLFEVVRIYNNFYEKCILYLHQSHAMQRTVQIVMQRNV